MTSNHEQLLSWMGATGIKNAQGVADALGISRSAADRAIRGEAGDLALRRIVQKIQGGGSSAPLESAVVAAIVRALRIQGHQAEMCTNPPWDFCVDGLFIQVKTSNCKDGGRTLIRRLAGLDDGVSE